MTSGLIALAAALAVAVAAGLAWQRTSGRIREARGEVLTAEQLGRQLGERATLVQFSTAFCAPCRATRRILSEVAGMVDGVVHVEIDATAHPELVRSLGIRSTPAVLVLGPGGAVARRASGQPRKADVIAALGGVV
jgi:thiol-disulfide isomerase/thioredoxin